MSQEQARRPRRRRSRAEAEQLVVEYQGSGMSQAEFCQRHGLALSTLARYQRRRRQERGGGAHPCRWVAVEVADPRPADASGLAVVLASGRRLEVGVGFDAATLERLLRALEPA